MVSLAGVKVAMVPPKGVRLALVVAAAGVLMAARQRGLPVGLLIKAALAVVALAA